MQFETWEPISDVPEKLYLEGLYDNRKGFWLELKGESLEGNTLRICFDTPLSYRNTNESNILLTISRFNFGGSSLFTTKQSEYVDWFLKESQGVINPRGVVHYAIYTPEDCVDVLADVEPTVEWVI